MKNSPGIMINGGFWHAHSPPIIICVRAEIADCLPPVLEPPCKTHLFPNWPSVGMINCLEVASCQLACDLCSLCWNHLLRTYRAASLFLSPFHTYYCWERRGPGLQGSHGKIGTLAPSLLTVKEIYRLILSSLLQFSRIVPAMSRTSGIKQNQKMLSHAVG